MLVSFMCGIAAVSLLWHSTYPDYAYAESKRPLTIRVKYQTMLLLLISHFATNQA